MSGWAWVGPWRAEIAPGYRGDQHLAPTGHVLSDVGLLSPNLPLFQEKPEILIFFMKLLE
jgi:hypothetical protein